jgi:hypothetical protein
MREREWVRKREKEKKKTRASERERCQSVNQQVQSRMDFDCLTRVTGNDDGMR